MTGSENHDSKSKASQCCQPPNQLVNLDIRSSKDSDIAYRETHFILGKIRSAIGDIPLIDTKLNFADRLDSWKARWGIRRMSFHIEPRLYAIGNPTETSPVFVTANYKMSFDRLRSQLDGIDGWILVLDTKGINVWCAASKGTFGTDEIVHRVEITGLRKIVTHNRLIVPQLGATGVSAHLVKQLSGFRVVYGPVRARDIKAFLQSGMKATPEMRRVTFKFPERIALIPVDVVGSLKYAIPASICFFFLSGLGSGLYSLDRVASYGIINAAIPLAAALVGAILPPALLPWLPGRAFSIKGAWTGILLLLGIFLLVRQHPDAFSSWLSLAGWFFLIPAATSFIGMNFTGSSTYTSLSGVKKEMRVAVPAQITGAAVGLGLWVTGLFV